MTNTPNTEATTATPTSTATSRKRRFRINSRYFFLTYSQSPTDQELHTLLNRVVAKESAKALTFARIVREKHADGSPHHHLLLCYQKRVDLTNPNRFDYVLPDQPHPNIQKVKSLPHVLDYLEKDGCFLDHGTFPLNSAKRTRDIIRSAIESESYSVGDYFRRFTSKEQRDVIYHDAHKINTYTKNVKAFQHHEALRKKPYLLSFDLDKIKAHPAYRNSHLPI